MAGTLTAATIDSGAASTPPTFSANGTQIGTLCRAWATFNGTNGSVYASFNVSSVTRQSTGKYTVTFTNAFSDANYSIHVAAGNGTSSAPYGCVDLNAAASTSSAFRAYVTNDGGTAFDSSYVYVSAFR